MKFSIKCSIKFLAALSFTFTKEILKGKKLYFLFSSGNVLYKLVPWEMFNYLLSEHGHAWKKNSDSKLNITHKNQVIH